MTALSSCQSLVKLVDGASHQSKSRICTELDKMRGIRLSAFAITLIAIGPLLDLRIICAHPAALERADWPLSSASHLNALDDGAQIDSRLKPDITSVRQDNRRPIWALAHMVNSIKELEYRLETGANAIETDVTFSRDGTPTHTYHGPPCDCWRHCHQQELFADFLGYIKAISIDTANGIGQNLTLLFLDLKLDALDQAAKERAGRELASSIVNHLFTPSQDETSLDPPEGELAPSRSLQISRMQSFSLILSVNHVNDIDLIRHFLHTLEVTNSSHLLSENIGFDVGMNDELAHIETMWRKLLNNGLKLNLWQGDGYTNCLSPFYNLERLSSAIAKRDNPRGYPAKVYHWTIDLHDRLRESLLMGVDAIMTNHPERLMTVLREPMIAHDFRLATRADKPFRKLTKGSLGRRDETARYQRSAYTPTGGLLSNLMDVLASWASYFREIPFLSYPAILMGRSSASSTSLAAAKRRSAPQSKANFKTVLLTPAGRTQSFNMTRVVLEKEPEYKVLANVSQTTTVVTPSGTSKETNLSDSSTEPPAAYDLSTRAMDQNEPIQLDYDGPRWYTSLMSHLLISWLRVVLPPPAPEPI